MFAINLNLFHHRSSMKITFVGIQIAILFLVERYKILLLSNKAAISLDSVNLPLFIYDLVDSDWLIYCFYFSHLWLAILLMGKSINICWRPTSIGDHPLQTIQQLAYILNSVWPKFQVKLQIHFFKIFQVNHFFFCFLINWCCLYKCILHSLIRYIYIYILVFLSLIKFYSFVVDFPSCISVYKPCNI